MPTPERMRRYREVAEGRQRGVVVLEDIHDPHNAEAVFRSCDAFGFQRVCLIFDEEEPSTPPGWIWTGRPGITGTAGISSPPTTNPPATA